MIDGLSGRLKDWRIVLSDWPQYAFVSGNQALQRTGLIAVNGAGKSSHAASFSR
jgi:hypothetical protein